jgi:hypothetical protein
MNLLNVYIRQSVSIYLKITYSDSEITFNLNDKFEQKFNFQNNILHK